MSGRYRERDRRYDGRFDRERASRYDKRYREMPPADHDVRYKSSPSLFNFVSPSGLSSSREVKSCVRPGKKPRELEEGELDNREVKETRRRERDMM